MAATDIIDAVNRGKGLAARFVGLPYDVHRASGASSPVRTGTALLRLPAHFVPQRSAMASHGHPYFEGFFDAAYTRQGDYLVGDWTYFVASQLPFEPVLCVRATRLVSIARPGLPASSGLGGYGGIVRGGGLPLLYAWPASVIAAGEGLDRGGLPSDASLPGLSVLLPGTGPVTVRTGDIVTDDVGRTGVVTAAETSEHGVKLLVKQVAT